MPLPLAVQVVERGGRVAAVTGPAANDLYCINILVRRMIISLAPGVKAINKQGLPWKAKLKDEFEGRTVGSFGAGLKPLPEEVSTRTHARTHAHMRQRLEMYLHYIGPCKTTWQPVHIPH